MAGLESLLVSPDHPEFPQPHRPSHGQAVAGTGASMVARASGPKISHRFWPLLGCRERADRAAALDAVARSGRKSQTLHATALDPGERRAAYRQDVFPQAAG